MSSGLHRLSLHALAWVAAIVLAGAGCASDKQHAEASGSRPTGDTGMTVKHGGDVPPQPARLDRADPPIVEAARRGDAARVKALLDGGADVNAFGSDRTTALMAAAEAGREDVARLLMDRKADVNLRNARGQTAAEVANAAGDTRLRAMLEAREVKPPPGPANPSPR